MVNNKGKSKIYIVILVVVLCLIVAGLSGYFVFKYYDEIKDRFHLDNDTASDTDKATGIDDYNANASEREIFFDDFDGLIAHGTGAVNTVTYTNSLEAYECSREKGISYIEVDVHCTKDNKFVCDHGWDGYSDVPTFEEFMSKKIDGVYTPMCLDDLFDLLENDASLHLILDMRMEKDQVKYFDDFINGLQDKDIKNRIAIILKKDYYELSKVTDKITMIYRAPKTAGYVEVAEFCREHHISTICYDPEYFESEIALPFFKNLGYGVLVYKDNDVRDAIKHMNDGAYGIFSDYISFKDLKAFE